MEPRHILNYLGSTGLNKQEEHLLDVSKAAVNTKYRVSINKGDTAFYSPDIPKIIEYIRDNYILIPKIKT